MRRSIVSVALLCLLPGELLLASEAPEQDAPPPAAEIPAAGEVSWTYEVGAQIWTPLTLEAEVLYFGDDAGIFRALDTSGRVPRWQFRASGRIRSAATIAGDLVLFASDDGFLYALEREDGTERWRFGFRSPGLERRLAASSPPYAYDYLHSSPVVDDGTVYIGSADNQLYAIDLASGKERWSFATKGWVRSTPAVVDGSVYFGSWDGHVYALSAEGGEERWRFATGGPVQGSPAVAGGRVIVGSRSAEVFALDVATGEAVWTYAHADGSWVESSPVVRDGVIYIGSSDALVLLALDAETGAELWRFRTGGWSWGTPVVTEDAVYIGSVSASPYYVPGVELEAGFHAVDRATGSKLWGLTTGPVEGYVTGGVFSSAAVAEGVVYVASLDGRIYAIRQE